MSGIGYGDDEYQWEALWPADLHLIGKEILRFHAVYWPAFLMAAEEPLPKQIFAHGWWLFEQEKMSKSRGNIKRPQPLARTLGIDPLRYFLLREMVFGQDGNFSYDAVLQRYNADLANDLGNLAKRTLDMIGRYFAGEVPPPGGGADQTLRDLEVARVAQQAIDNALAQYDRYEFSRALETIWGLVAEVNKYIVENEPWALAGDPAKRARLATVLYTCAESVRVVAALACPVMPHAAQTLWDQLGLRGEVGRVSLDELAWGQLASGTVIGTPEAIFPRVKKDEALEKIEAIEEEIEAQAAGRPAPVAHARGKEAKSNVITIEDFAKVEMKVGEVKAAEKVAGADKLLKIQVDVGDEVRQVVAGIAEVYKPEELIGRKVIVVTNLQPRKLRGVESNGMIVAASVPPDGKPVLAGFLESVPVGARLK
jgi:methionyl-tRNA synthetase